MKNVSMDEICQIVTDFVANGSFKSLRDNVDYLKRGYARLIRLVDYHSNFSKEAAVFISKESYNFLSKTKLYGGEIVISNVGNIGESFMVPKLNCPMSLGPNAIMIKTNQIDKYISYYFQTDMGIEKLKSLTGGSAIPKFNKTEFKKLHISIHEIEEQQHIVDTIGSVDDLIEKYQLIIKKIRDFRSLLFMDFSKENNECVEISSLVSFVSGAQPPKKQHIYEPREGYVRFIQNRDYSSSSHLTYIPVSKKNKICDKFDIMIDKYGEAGTTRCGIDGAYNVALLKIVPIKETYREYIRDFLSQEEIRKVLDASSQASTRASLNEGTFTGIKIPFNEKIVEEYEKIARPLQSLIFSINDNIQKLERTKNLLLQKYFN